MVIEKGPVNFSFGFGNVEYKPFEKMKDTLKDILPIAENESNEDWIGYKFRTPELPSNHKIEMREFRPIYSYYIFYGREVATEIFKHLVPTANDPRGLHVFGEIDVAGGQIVDLSGLLKYIEKLRDAGLKSIEGPCISYGVPKRQLSYNNLEFAKCILEQNIRQTLMHKIWEGDEKQRLLQIEKYLVFR